MELKEPIDGVLLEWAVREEAKLKGWIARDENGDLHFFINKPNRYNRRGVFEMYPGVWSLNEFSETRTFPLSKEKFPDVKWADKPREVEITIRYSE